MGPAGGNRRIRLHGATENLASAYTDPATGAQVFTDLADAWGQTSFIMP